VRASSPLLAQMVTSEVFNGDKEITKAQAKALGEFFNVDYGLFM
jgi:HTH-type transcriptional regulator / antitoxin HigA